MQLDAKTLSEDTTLEADVCIVGAGPVGLSLAAELAGGAARVIVLESGSGDANPAAQSLNAAAAEGDPHGGFEASRHRQIGGTACIWSTPLVGVKGAKYVPLDAIDFRGELGRAPWPIDFTDLEPFYHRAQVVAGIGRFDYRSASWKLPASPIPDDHPVLASGIYQFGSAQRFCVDLPRTLSSAANVTLCHDATAVRTLWRGRTVDALEAVSSSGNRFSVRARQLVLAGGGVENTRLLLVAAHDGHLRDESGWLGHGFVEHPRDYSITLRSRSAALLRRLEFFDRHEDGDTTLCGRVAIRDEAIRRLGLPNAAITLLPLGRRARPFHWRIESIAQRTIGWNLQWPPGYGWSRWPALARRFAGFQLLINLEEFAHHDNTLGLEPRSDRLGVRRVRLQRRWHQDDRERLARLREAVASGFGDIGLGPLTLGPLVAPDPNSAHHLGTTRMGSDPKSGVTDSHGLVFGTANLHVAGGSLFPSSGFANPTLTAIALALRLADRLAAGA
ncbi:MAG: hypothetical protein KJZ83_05180 [Burkholderiaceae bacterium]|nr:hypothetical protein [Burkholderiaceae bacterium]